MADLSKLSTEDLQALQSGDLSKVSTAGLQALRGGASTSPVEAPASAAAPAGIPAPQPAPPTPVKLGKEGFAQSLEEAFQAEASPTLAKFVAGIGSAPAQAWQSVKQLMGKDVPEADIQAQRAITDTGPGMVGNIAGNVAMLPFGGKEAQAAKYFARTLGPKAATAARMGTAAGISGAENAAFTPVAEGESRGMNALIGAAAPVALQGASKAVTGLVTPTKQAQELIAQGIQPTVAQGGKGNIFGKALGYLEDLVDEVPLLNKLGVSQGRERAEKELIDVAGRRSSPYFAATKELPERGAWATTQRKQFDKAYDELLKGVEIDVGQPVRTEVRAAITPSMKAMDRSARQDLERELSNIFPDGVDRMTGRQWKDAQNEVRRLARDARADYAKNGDRSTKNLAEAYEAVDAQLTKARNAAVDPDVAKRLDVVDDRYAHSLTFRKALGYSQQAGKPLEPRHLFKAVEATTPTNLKVERSGRFQDLTDPGAVVFGKDEGMDAVKRRIANAVAGLGVGGALTIAGGPLTIPLALGATSLGATKTGSKFLMGQNEWQKKLAEALRERMGSTAGAITTGE